MKKRFQEIITALLMLVPLLMLAPLTSYMYHEHAHVRTSTDMNVHMYVGVRHGTDKHVGACRGTCMYVHACGCKQGVKAAAISPYHVSVRRGLVH